jgi:hypothetical protein
VIGDKIALRRLGSGHARGVVETVIGDSVRVRLGSTGELVTASRREVINYSSAARKAWLSRPQRAVGRPKGSRVSDRVSVTLRIDRALWEKFRALEAAGKIESRTEAINAWLEERVVSLGRSSI